jgi:hypothetical protein
MASFFLGSLSIQQGLAPQLEFRKIWFLQLIYFSLFEHPFNLVLNGETVTFGNTQMAVNMLTHRSMLKNWKFCVMQ